MPAHLQPEAEGFMQAKRARIVEGSGVSVANIDQLEAQCRSSLELALRVAPPRDTALGPKPWDATFLQPDVSRLQKLLGENFQHFIGVIATSGCGKSTLLNALLGVDALPTATGEACTSAPVLVRHGALEVGKYEVVIRFIPKEIWLEEVKEYQEAIEHGIAGSKEKCEQMEAKFKAVYPGISTRGELPENEVTSVLRPGSQNETRRPFNSLEDMIVFLETYVVSKGDGPHFWPVVQEAEIIGPFDFLHNGTVLVDLPGDRDANSARAAAAEKFTKRLDEFLVAVDMKRLITDPTIKEFLERSGARKLIAMDGHRTLTVAVTKCELGVEGLSSEKVKRDWGVDLTNIDEKIALNKAKLANKELPAEERIACLEDKTRLPLLWREAAAEARRKHYQPVFERNMRGILDTWASTLRSGRKVGLETFWTGALDFQNLQKGEEPQTFVAEAGTEVPRLKDHISASYLRRREARAQAIVNLLDSVLRSLERMDEVTILEEKFRKDLDKLKQDVLVALAQSRDEMIKSIEQIIAKHILDPLKGSVVLQVERMHALPEQWRTLQHNTYKAILRHNGKFDGTTGSFNWNKDLCVLLQEVMENGYDACFAELEGVCDIFCDNVMSNISVLRALMLETQELSEDVRKAAEGLVAELEDYLSARRAVAKLAWTEGLVRVRRSFADRLWTEVQAGMLPIYSEVLDVSGPKVQMLRTKAMSEKLNKELSGILHEAIQHMQRHIEAACGAEEGGLAASLATAMVDTSREKIVGEVELFFDTKVHGSRDQEMLKRHAKDVRDERAKLQRCTQRVAAQGHNIAIGVEAGRDVRKTEAFRKLLQKKVCAMRALRCMSSGSSP